MVINGSWWVLMMVINDGDWLVLWNMNLVFPPFSLGWWSNLTNSLHHFRGVGIPWPNGWEPRWEFLASSAAFPASPETYKKSRWSPSMRMIAHNFKPKHIKTSKAVFFTRDVRNRFCRYGKSRIFPGAWRICRIYVDLPGGLVCFEYCQPNREQIHLGRSQHSDSFT